MLLASPLQQKLSTTDPSLRFIELARSQPADVIKIGVTHGALAIEGKHQPNDFPIALNAASRAGLDYLAIGHWHNWLPDTDGGRIVMPGTPEPDRFGNDQSGHVAYVEIDGPGQLPRVQPLPINTLAWKSVTFDFVAPDASRATLDAVLNEHRATANQTVLRVSFTGVTSPALLAQTRSWLEGALKPFLVGQIVDRTRIALSGAELADLKSRHPILAQTIADIDRLEALATGEPNRAQEPAIAADGASAPLTLAEIQALLGPSKIDLASLTPELFSQLRQMLFQTLQEVTT
jgi:DNA repair exonuclease SbcCD nuclease subunit